MAHYDDNELLPKKINRRKNIERERAKDRHIRSMYVLVLILLDTLIPPHLREDAVALVEVVHEAREPLQLIRKGLVIRCIIPP